MMGQIDAILSLKSSLKMVESAFHSTLAQLIPNLPLLALP